MNIICAICGQHIESAAVDPLSLHVHSEGKTADQEEEQHFYCHASCLRGVLNEDMPFLWD